MLSTSPLLIRQYMKHLVKAKGKGIRALSVLTAAIDNDNNISEDAIHFAASIELLHLATLVHDDVMDDADTRRGIMTLHKKYGRKTAVICGDYLLALAMNNLSKVSGKEQYQQFDMSGIMLDIALGELSQHLNNGNLKLSIKEYLEIIRGKTARLFEASFYAGLITFNQDEKVIEDYRRFGELLGMIFQITDDCLDFESSTEEMLKPVQSDYEQGVITLPLIYAMDQNPALRERVMDYATINAEVKKYKGVEMAHKTTRKYYEESLALLETMTTSEIKRNSMLELLNKSMRFV